MYYNITLKKTYRAHQCRNSFTAIPTLLVCLLSECRYTFIIYAF